MDNKKKTTFKRVNTSGICKNNNCSGCHHLKSRLKKHYSILEMPKPETSSDKQLTLSTNLQIQMDNLDNQISNTQNEIDMLFQDISKHICNSVFDELDIKFDK